MRASRDRLTRCLNTVQALLARWREGRGLQTIENRGARTVILITHPQLEGNTISFASLNRRCGFYALLCFFGRTNI